MPQNSKKPVVQKNKAGHPLELPRGHQNRGQIMPSQFIIHKQDALYAIYQKHWTNWFFLRDISGILRTCGENKGFLQSAKTNNIFEINTKNKRRRHSYKLKPEVVVAVHKLKGLSYDRQHTNLNDPDETTTKPIECYPQKKDSLKRLIGSKKSNRKNQEESRI